MSSTSDSGARQRLIVATFGAMAASAVVFAALWIWREVPSSYGCGDDEPPGQDAAIDAFRSGTIQLHLVVAMALVTAIVLLARARSGAAHGRPAVGPPTIVGLALMGLFVAASLADHGVFVLPAFLAGLASLVVIPGLAVLAAVALVMLRRGRERWSLNVTLVAAWLALVLALPGHMLAMYSQGTGPILC